MFNSGEEDFLGKVNDTNFTNLFLFYIFLSIKQTTKLLNKQTIEHDAKINTKL